MRLFILVPLLLFSICLNPLIVEQSVRAQTPDFDISSYPLSRTVNNGSSTTYAITVSSLNNFNSPVSLSVPSLPAGLSGTFDPSSVTPAANGFALSTLTVGAASTTGAGSYNITIVGVSASLTHSILPTLTVQVVTPTPIFVTIKFVTSPANTGGITLDGSSRTDGDTLSKNPGTYNITANPASGYTFTRWETYGPVSVANPNVPSTTCTIAAGGILTMVQTSYASTPTPPPQGCLIATALYGSPLEPEVQFLRHFRDETLVKVAGQSFRNGLNDWYYSFSPQVSEFIRQNQWMRPPIILLISPSISLLHTVDAIIQLITH